MKNRIIDRYREVRARDEQGFTLMEMLIVVAIIAVLIAIAIPTFTSQLENSREATDAANLRSAYAEVNVAALNEDTANYSKDVDAHQTDGTQWNNSAVANGSIGEIAVSSISPSTTGWTVAYNPTTQSVSITAK